MPMRLVCSQCATRFESLIIHKEQAIPDLMRKLVLHWEGKHKEEMREIAKGIAEASTAFSWYVTMKALSFVPGNEPVLLDQLEKSLDVSMKALGFDDEEEEDEGEDDEGEIDEDPSKDALDPLETPENETKQVVESIPIPS